jgi:hypothetical protein
VLQVEKRTATDSYNVFVEDPLKGAADRHRRPGAGRHAVTRGLARHRCPVDDQHRRQ